MVRGMKPLDVAVEAVAQTLGIDTAEIVRRKAFLEFTDEDAARLKVLHAALQDVAVDFADDFYAHLHGFEETHRFIPDAQTLERLKQTQAAYFESLTAGDYGPEYIHYRLRVGIAHQRVGLAPKWYLGAYCKYVAGLLPQIRQRLGDDPASFVATCQSLVKIVLLDMGLAIDTYIQADRRAILSLKRYAENIIASLPAGLVVLDSSRKVLSVNRSFRELFGMDTGEDPSGRALDELLPVPGLRRQIEDVLANGMAVYGFEAMLDKKWLCLKVVAEGMETQEQFEFLLERGCDAMQGYFFSKPLPAEEIPRLQQNAQSSSFGRDRKGGLYGRD